MSRPVLDWNDRAAVSTWLANLRVSLDDADAVTQDMLLPPRERQLGPALHAEKYRDAWAQIEESMAYAMGTKPKPRGGGGPEGAASSLAL
jgi:hypothetical protein